VAITYYSPGNYDNPIGPDGRARTIAAFHVAQVGDVLARVPMRRDVLEVLTSPSAIRYWLNQRAGSRSTDNEVASVCSGLPQKASLSARRARLVVREPTRVLPWCRRGAGGWFTATRLRISRESSLNSSLDRRGWIASACDWF
jgi:hypothetical protein